MSYATAAELKVKYSKVTSTSLTDTQLAARLTAAYALINMRLSRRYVVPVTATCQVLKDLEMDLAFAAIAWRPYEGGEVTEDANTVPGSIRKEARKFLEELRTGEVDLVDDTGVTVAAKTSTALYSNTQGLASAFNLKGELEWGEPEEPEVS
jgi:phage gp36-like protein